MLVVKGKLVSKSSRTKTFTNKQTGVRESFKQDFLYLVNGGSPIEVACKEGTGADYNVDDEYELPVYIRAFRSGAGAAYRLHLSEN